MEPIVSPAKTWLDRLREGQWRRCWASRVRQGKLGLLEPRPVFGVAGMQAERLAIAVRGRTGPPRGGSKVGEGQRE